MFKTLTTLIRATVAEADEAVFDANAIRVLAQQLREAAASLEHSKRELACAMAHQATEERAVEGLSRRIGDLEASARDAIVAGREDLATEAAGAIASAEDERAERRSAVQRFDADVRRLRRLVEEGGKRLMDLRRGLELARAQEALQRAGASGRRAVTIGTGALREAEATLARIREQQTRADDMAEALDELDRQSSARDVCDRMAAAGFGNRPRTRPEDVLARIRAGAGTAGSEDQPETLK